MVDPIVEPENITILMKNLVKKIRIKCYNEDLDQGNYNYTKIEVKSPHEPAHCEGCIQGIRGYSTLQDAVPLGIYVRRAW